MRCAAIDIGSNAVRLLIAEKTSAGRIRTIEDLRFPLRLGHDTFSLGYISKDSRDKLQRAFNLFLKTTKKYQVERVAAIATSAFREANNRDKVVRELKKATGIPIQMINGEKEAALVHLAVLGALKMGPRKNLLIDIGGGSVELVVTSRGKRLFVKSLPLGTVRLLKALGNGANYQNFADHILDELEPVLARSEPLRDLTSDDLLIGTGGNLRALGKLSAYIKNQTYPKRQLSRVEIREMASLLFELSYDKRLKHLDLRADRADVILPASVFLLELMKLLQLHAIQIPNVGVKNGVLRELMRRQPPLAYRAFDLA